MFSLVSRISLLGFEDASSGSISIVTEPVIPLEEALQHDLAKHPEAIAWGIYQCAVRMLSCFKVH
jgi:hypothetical protein